MTESLEDKAQATLFSRIKDIPPFIASALTIGAALIAIGTVIFGYFATKHQLNVVRCISNNNETLLSLQVEQIVFYNQYLDLARQLANEESSDKANISSKEHLKNEKEYKWRRLQEKRIQAEELSASIRNNLCGET